MSVELLQQAELVRTQLQAHIDKVTSDLDELWYVAITYTYATLTIEMGDFVVYDDQMDTEEDDLTFTKCMERFRRMVNNLSRVASARFPDLDPQPFLSYHLFASLVRSLRLLSFSSVPVYQSLLA